MGMICERMAMYVCMYVDSRRGIIGQSAKEVFNIWGFSSLIEITSSCVRKVDYVQNTDNQVTRLIQYASTLRRQTLLIFVPKNSGDSGQRLLGKANIGL